MKKVITAALLLIMTILLISSFFLVSAASRIHQVSFQESGGVPQLSVKYTLGEETVLPWYDEENDIWYYFLPAYIQENKIWCGNLKDALCIDGAPMADKTFIFEPGKAYSVESGAQPFCAVFCRSANVSSIFIHTGSGNMEYVNSDKNHEEAGQIVSISGGGAVEYAGEMKKISGHGNIAWEQEKKPYNIKLSSSGSPGGLGSAKDFCLISLWYDGDKIHSRLGFDIGKILNVPYTSDCAWVDLYLNGEYQGLYLLAESVNSHSVFTANEDAFLLEKEIADPDYQARYADKTSFFTGNGNLLIVERPKEATDMQLSQIFYTIQAAEIAINSQDYEPYIDVDSFAAQFLIDEISMNYDAFVSSFYLYRADNSDKLHAGPAWDYDGAFGEFLYLGHPYGNPEATVLGERNGWQFDWYEKLYPTQAFQDSLHRQLEAFLPQLQELFSEKIPAYAAYISASSENDDIRWGWTFEETSRKSGNYKAWENRVRYLQYFCLNRLKCLCDRYYVTGEQVEWIPEAEKHTLTFMANGKCVYSLTVNDGETVDISEIAELRNYTDNGWHLSYRESKVWNEYMPVLEDCVLIYE